MANLSKISYKGTTYDIYDAGALRSVPLATYQTLGGVKPVYSNTSAATGITSASGSKTVALEALSTTANRYYAVEVDKDGRLYVNVPWTIPINAYTLGGYISDPAGYYVQLSLNGAQSSYTIVPEMTGATSLADGTLGLVPKPKALYSDYAKFLKGDATWAAVNEHNVWFYNVETNYGEVSPGQGNWTATFPSANRVVNTANLVSASGFNGGARVGDTIITTGGFVGYVTELNDGTDMGSATFVGRLSFMAFNSPTAYDSSTETLTLGSY